MKKTTRSAMLSEKLSLTIQNLAMQEDFSDDKKPARLAKLKRKVHGLLRSIGNQIVKDFFPDKVNPGCKCPVCNRWFQTWKALGRHFAERHGKVDAGYLTCTCGQHFPKLTYGKRGMTGAARLGSHLANLKDPTTHCVLAAIGGD